MPCGKQGLLTTSELDLLRPLAEQGLSNDELAAHLRKSRKTVDSFLYGSSTTDGILAKLGVSNRSQAIRWYDEHFGAVSVLLGLLLQTHMGKLDEAFKDSLLGLCHRAIRSCRSASRPLENAIGKLSPSASVSTTELYRILGLTLSQQIWAFSFIAFRDQIWNTTFSLCNEVEQIAKRIDDRELHALTYVHRGVARYVMGEYGLSSAQLLDALDPDLRLSTNDQLDVLRILSLNYAHMDQPRESRKYQGALRNLVESGNANLERIVVGYEGLARAEALLGFGEEALKDLEQAQKVLASISAPFREQEVRKTRYQIARQISPDDKRYLEVIGGQALDVGKAFQRHRKIVEEWLNEDLDSPSSS